MSESFRQVSRLRLYVLWWHALGALNSHFHFKMVAVTVISWFMRKKGGRDDFTRPDLSQLSLLFPENFDSLADEYFNHRTYFSKEILGNKFTDKFVVNLSRR